MDRDLVPFNKGSDRVILALRQVDDLFAFASALLRDGFKSAARAKELLVDARQELTSLLEQSLEKERNQHGDTNK